MNVETGEIKEFETDGELLEALRSGNWELLGRRPRKSCNKCYGRGWDGRDIKSGQFHVCACVKDRNHSTKADSGSFTRSNLYKHFMIPEKNGK